MDYTLKHEISTVLNMVKGFEAGYSSKSENRMLVSLTGTVYLCEIVDGGEGSVSLHSSKLDDKGINVFKDIRNALYLQENMIKLFNAVKGFEAGLISSRIDAFVLEHKGVVYGLYFSELGTDSIHSYESKLK